MDEKEVTLNRIRATLFAQRLNWFCTGAAIMYMISLFGYTFLSTVLVCLLCGIAFAHVTTQGVLDPPETPPS